jgi:hypothetical protein
MQLPILIEPTADGRVRAQIGEPFHLAAEAEDAQRALQQLVHLVEQRLQGGVQIGVLSVTDGRVQARLSPFPADDAYQTDWVYRELQESLAENRRLEDSAGS